MKSLAFVLSFLVSFNVFASSFDGVPMTCLEKAEKRMQKHKRMGLVSVCKERKNPNIEHYTFSDGSQMTGFSADVEKGCALNNWWNGQDDQDQVDPVEWKKECLVEEDFKVTEVKTTLKAQRDSSLKLNIPNSDAYVIVNEIKNNKDIEFAEAVGKNIRRSYYQKGYSVKSSHYQEVDFDTMVDLLKKSEGEFKKLNEDEIAEVYSWYEDKHVTSIYLMNLETEYMSGTGFEQVFILVPDVKYESILTIGRFFYAE